MCTKYQTVEEVIIDFNKCDPWHGIKIQQATDTGPFGESALHTAAIWNSPSAIHLLLLAGCNVNQKGENGYTPLHDAIDQENLDAVIELLKHKPKLVQNNYGDDQIEFANTCKNSEIKSLVINYFNRKKST